MDINTLNNILSAIACIGSIFGVIGFVRSCRKPKARLRFANGKKVITLSLHYYVSTEKYYVVPWPNTSEFDKYHRIGEQYEKKHKNDNVFVLSFRLSNTGKLQLEDYRVELLLDGGFQSLAPTVCKPRKVIGNYIEPAELEDVRFTNGKPQVVFSPIDNRPLNQGDYEDFSFRFTPTMEAEKIELTWRIVAKDFSDKGKLVIHLKPNVTQYTNIKPVYREVDIPEGAERVDDLTPYIKEFQELLKQ